MQNDAIRVEFQELSTPLLADACLRVGVPLRAAPPGIRPLMQETRVAGSVLPARHSGSVDIFLEAMTHAREGDVLVIDNDGRQDEACIGDLIVLEARACGLAGIIVWGQHRDTEELLRIRFPVFSYGAWAPGPRRLDWQKPEALHSAQIGAELVGRTDVVFGDIDGVLFVAADRVREVLEQARAIRRTERQQARQIAKGRSLFEQLQFRRYLARRSQEPDFTFRLHLREIEGEIEV